LLGIKTLLEFDSYKKGGRIKHGILFAFEILGYFRPKRRHKNVIIYEFYRRVPKWEDEDRFIGSLPERRKEPQRITHRSIINLAKLLAPENDVLKGKIYFVRKEFFDSFFSSPSPPRS
jgi:hypothetical protein